MYHLFNQPRVQAPDSRFPWPELNRRIWLRAIVIGGVLGVTALLSYGLTPSVAALALALPLGIGGIILLLTRPHLGPLALIVIGLVGNVAITDNFNASVLFLCLLTGLWILERVARKQPLLGLRSLAVFPLLMLVATTVLAFLVGQLNWYDVPSAPIQAQIGGLLVTVLSAAIFLMVGAYITELRWLKWMVWTFMLLGSLYVIGRISTYPFRYLILLFPWGSTASLYWLWLSALLFSQLLFNRDLGMPGRLLLGALLAGALYAGTVQTFEWLSGWVPSMTALLAIAALRWPRLGIAMGVMGVLSLPALYPFLASIDEYSYETRVDAWLIMFDIIKVNPLIGLGPSNYHWYTHLYAIRGYSVNFNSHNQYVDLLAQTGILGLFFYLWFFAAVTGIAWRLRRIVPPGFPQAYVYGALGGLAGMFIAGILGDWILPFVYNVGLVGMRSSLLGWLFLGGLLTLERLYGDSPRAITSISASPATR